MTLSHDDTARLQKARVNYDPERGLYVPSRRRFFFLGGLALAGTVVKGWTLEPAKLYNYEVSPLREILELAPPFFPERWQIALYESYRNAGFDVRYASNASGLIG